MRLQALVLAGARASGDPVATAEGVTHRALACVGGAPMLERVVGVLLEAQCTPIHVSTSDPDLLRATPALAERAASSELRHHASRPSPAESVADFLDATAAAETLVTTADHALLTGEALCHFLEAARAAHADAVVGVVASSVFRARFPDARRTFVPLRPEPVTGANLFLLRGPGALRVARLWTRLEAHRKRPLRLAARFGPLALARLALGRMDLDEALERVSRAAGARLRAVRLPFATCAIDVDTVDDLALARRLSGAAVRGGAVPRR